MKTMITCIMLMLLFSHSIKMEERAPMINNNNIIKSKINIEELEEFEGKINDLHILHPAFRNKVILLIHECKKQGIDLKVIETYRSNKRQNRVKRRGSSMLAGGYSKHQYFLAVDIVPIDKKGNIIWHNRKLWKKIGQIGKKQGLIWGGDWKRFRDDNHFEYDCSLDEVNKIAVPDTVIVPLNY